MDASQQAPGFDGFRRLGNLIHSHVVVDARLFGEAASAEVANHLANNAGVAERDEARGRRFQLEHDRRGVVQGQLPIEGRQISALGGKHFVPFLARFAGGQAVPGLLERSVNGPGFSGLDQQMRGAGEDQFL